MTFKTHTEMKDEALSHSTQSVKAIRSWQPRSTGLIKACALALTLAACGGGGGGPSSAGVDPTPPVSSAECTGQCTTDASFLTVQDVQKVMSQAIAEAQMRGANATIAVTDRVGNVLGVYRMGDAATRKVTIATQLDANGQPVVITGLEGISLPTKAAPVNLDHLAAISKAVTASYLSSEGNAFSTRSANQIVQDHFNPKESFQPGGPLFGVQFSQLGCSDFSQRANMVSPSQGPMRSPLGLSADPGGLPLYKGGAVVGAIGVIADGVYGIDAEITDLDTGMAALDESIAWAGSFGFVAPVRRRGAFIAIDGKQFRFSDVDDRDMMSNLGNAPDFASIPPSVGQLIPVALYTNGTIQQGTAFGTPASGIRPDTDLFPGRDAFVFVDANNVNRFPPISATDNPGTAPLTAVEVQAIIDEALNVANTGRAGIRQPLQSQIRVTVSVVDSQGRQLGMARTRDAPVFGADVSLQKARSVGLLSSPTAAQYISGLPPARYLTTTDGETSARRTINLGSYVDAYRAFVANPTGLTGETAFGDRSIGNLARPFFPDGFDTATNGPLSKPRGEWSVFSSGLQLDLSINAILQHVLTAAGALPPEADAARGCLGVALAPDLSSVGLTPENVGVVRAGNGLQIFAGGVPIYRDNVMVGAIGISGDGIDQDDMIAFLGLDRAGRRLNTGIGHAPKAIRADALITPNTPLASSPMRYVQCPTAPFLNSDEQEPCKGK